MGRLNEEARLYGKWKMWIFQIEIKTVLLTWTIFWGPRKNGKGVDANHPIKYKEGRRNSTWPSQRLTKDAADCHHYDPCLTTKRSLDLGGLGGKPEKNPRSNRRDQLHNYTHTSSKFVFQIRFWPPLYMHASKATKYHKLLKESDKNLAQLLLVENTEILKD